MGGKDNFSKFSNLIMGILVSVIVIGGYNVVQADSYKLAENYDNGYVVSQPPSDCNLAGIVGTGVGQPNSTAITVEQKTTGVSGDNVLQIYDNQTAAGAQVMKTFAPISSGKFVAEFKFMNIKSGGPKPLTFWLTDATGGFAGPNAIIRTSLYKSNQYVFDGATGRLIANMIFTENNWYKVKAVVDVDNNRFDLYFNEELVAKDYAFRNIRKPIDRIVLGTSNESTLAEVQYKIDDIRVYTIKNSTIPVFNYNFNGYNTGAVPVLWYLIGGGTGNQVSIENQSIGDNYMKITSINGATQTIGVTKPLIVNKSSTFSLRFAYKLPSSNVSKPKRIRIDLLRTGGNGVCLSLYPNKIIAFDNDYGSVGAQNVNGGEYTLSTGMTPGREYLATIVVNPQTKRYDLYIDDVKVVNQYAFRNEANTSPVSTLNMQIPQDDSYQMGDVTASVDDISILDGAVIPTDVTVLDYDTAMNTANALVTLPVGAITNVSKVIRNSSSVTKNIDVFIATYDANNRLMNVAMQNDTLAAGQKKLINTTLTLPANTNTVKSFVWDGDNLKPYCLEYTLTK